MQSIARAALDGELEAEALLSRPYAESRARLLQLRGVGPWTADMVGIFHFHDPDIWPQDDVAAVGCLRRLTGQADTSAVAAAFAPYHSILARYLWRIKDVASLPGQPPAARTYNYSLTFEVTP